jgi:hypothetical protein
MTTLSDDVWATVCTFQPIRTLYRFGRVNHFFHDMIFVNNNEQHSLIWKDHCQSLLKMYGIQKVPNTIENYMLFYREYIEFKFDHKRLNLRTSLVRFTNNGHTVVNCRTRSHRYCWENLCVTNCDMTKGNMYEFEMIIDKQVEITDQTWHIIVGINNAKLQCERKSEREFGSWISVVGYGIGLIVSTGEIIYNNGTSLLLAKEFKDKLEVDEKLIHDGDTIGVRVDLTNCNETNNMLIDHITRDNFDPRRFQRKVEGEILTKEYGTIEFFLNGKPLLEQPFSGLKSQVYYPYVSLFNGQQVTILKGLYRTKQLAQQYK